MTLYSYLPYFFGDNSHSVFRHEIVVKTFSSVNNTHPQVGNHNSYSFQTKLSFSMSERKYGAKTRLQILLTSNCSEILFDCRVVEYLTV